MQGFPHGCQADVGVAADQSLGFEPGEQLACGVGGQVPRALEVVAERLTAISWEDGPALALTKPLVSGPDYIQLLRGINDVDGGSGWASFLARNDGAPVDLLHIDMILTRLANTAIRVTDVRIHLIGIRKPNLTGTFIPIPHAGGQAPYHFSANLDAPTPKLVGTGGQQSFSDFNIELAPREQSTLAIDFTARHHSYKWVLLIDYLDGMQQRTMKVTEPGGRPFAVTGTGKTYSTRYASDFPSDGGYHLER
jgi:hypothetical protein